jgi:predicted nucleotide-binding protein
MELRLLQIKKLLAENRINQGALQMWIGFMRAQLQKIYGKDSEIPRYFLPIKEKLTPSAVKEITSILVERVEAFLDSVCANGVNSFAGRKKGKVFIGHGRSPLWRELKDFVNERLGLSWDEFNREAVAGLTTFERISQMLIQAEFAFLIMTAEDEHADSTLHARENVVHEVGLFQGKLGPRKAIILLEEGCREFSNIIGLSQLRFPKGHISAVFEEIRRVLEREGVI